TMVNLLGRFYDVQEGRILVDGIDVRQLSMQQLREQLGIVFQDSFLFRGTVWNNLSYGRPHTTIEEGLRAAKAAGAHDFICRTQLGYETQLGEQGSGLSGGEKQRLSIARTLLYDPKILVLDEATSNIDAEAEKSIQEALEVLIRGRTTVAIAHRLSTLRNADRILVFERGKLIEQGSHAQLLEQDGTYARLVRIQTQVSNDPNVDRLLDKMQGRLSRDGEDEQAAAVTENRKPHIAAARTSHHTMPRRVLAAVGASASGVSGGTNDGDGNAALALLDEPTPPAVPPHQGPDLNWLAPDLHQFQLNDDGQIQLTTPTGQITNSETTPVFVTCTFPASHPERYLSVRTWSDNGEDVEVGLISNLEEWPYADQDVVRQSLSRKYLMRTIVGIVQIKLAFGFLEFDVETTDGRQQFLMRWTGSQALDFADNGKLLIDTEENRYVVPNVDALPKRDRERFLQFIYW
ncbi:MAG: DUF1854 domain-containing protein, partial [Planctomycetales bacterium]|nr:DUF1854 domain-containing protein [Planctomycetales bacterium]